MPSHPLHQSCDKGGVGMPCLVIPYTSHVTKRGGRKASPNHPMHYWSIRWQRVSPDIIPSGWLGSKHQLTKVTKGLVRRPRLKTPYTDQVAKGVVVGPRLFTRYTSHVTSRMFGRPRLITPHASQVTKEGVKTLRLIVPYTNEWRRRWWGGLAYSLQTTRKIMWQTRRLSGKGGWVAEDLAWSPQTT